MTKKGEYIGFVFTLVILLFVTFSNPLFAADQPLKLRVLSSWGLELWTAKDWLVPYVQRLNQKSAGRLQVSWVGPEAVPAFEQLRPLSAGLFDILFTAPAYHIGEVGVSAGLDLVKLTPKQKRAAGFYKLLDEAYSKINAKLLGLCTGDLTYNFLLKKELSKADFTGLKLRSTSVYDSLVRGLGGVTVRIPTGEVYSALEKGVVDGTGWPVFGALSMKFNEVTKFQLRPQFGQVHEVLLINLDTWEKMPKDLQNVLTQITEEWEEDGYRILSAMEKTEEEKMVSLGVKLNVLSPAEGKKLLAVYYERTMDELATKLSPEFGPRWRELSNKVLHR